MNIYFFKLLLACFILSGFCVSYIFILIFLKIEKESWTVHYPCAYFSITDTILIFTNILN